MAKRRLTERLVASARNPGKYHDGLGLYLRVRPSGGGYWEQRLTVDGRRRTVGIGSYPVVDLLSARRAAFENRARVEAGEFHTSNRVDSSSLTFAEAALTVRDLNAPNWRNPRTPTNWLRSLERHAFPRLGSRPVSDITTADLMDLLAPMWTSRQRTARVVRERISTVMKWAIAQQYRQDDPAALVLSALPRLPRPPQVHFRAMHYSEVPAALATVQSSSARPITKLAFRFLVLTATRSGETREARWQEIDLDRATWTIPGHRMKAGVEHRVPLSGPALAVLRDAGALVPESSLVFPLKPGKPIAQNTISQLLRRHGVGGVPHGFRSSFRDWCADTGVAREVAEKCLAHAVGNEVEAAYARSDLFDRRVEVMEAWARYLCGAVSEH